jgi:zeta-carotene desaturase
MTSAEVIVVGGGIAGIACALRLATSGLRVTLLETRRKLGGRATSFIDVRSGEVLDNCQHVALGCCTNYLDLLTMLGVADRIAWSREQFWLQPGGRLSVVAAGLLPAPLHFAGSIASAGFLSLTQKHALGHAMRRILRADRADWSTRTFDQFLREAGQDEATIRSFWSPVVVSACNLGVDRVSAGVALQVFQEGFLANRHAADIGVSSVPLLRLYDRAEEVITRAGGRVVLGFSATCVDARRVEGVLGTQRVVLDADRVVCALPPERAVEVISEDLTCTDPRIEPLRRLAHSPIIGVHLFMDRPVLRLPHAVLVPRGEYGQTHWLFRKDAEGRAVHAVISAADEWLDLDETRIGERVMRDLRAYVPAAQRAVPLRIRAVKERRATFAATPEGESLRPSVTGEDPEGLILAGDYTRTGWPATMEGATRSGYMAAAAVLGLPPPALLVPDMPTAPVARALGL